MRVCIILANLAFFFLTLTCMRYLFCRNLKHGPKVVVFSHPNRQPKDGNQPGKQSLKRRAWWYWWSQESCLAKEQPQIEWGWSRRPWCPWLWQQAVQTSTKTIRFWVVWNGGQAIHHLLSCSFRCTRYFAVCSAFLMLHSEPWWFPFWLACMHEEVVQFFRACPWFHR